MSNTQKEEKTALLELTKDTLEDVVAALSNYRLLQLRECDYVGADLTEKTRSRVKNLSILLTAQNEGGIRSEEIRRQTIFPRTEGES